MHEPTKFAFRGGQKIREIATAVRSRRSLRRGRRQAGNNARDAKDWLGAEAAFRGYLTLCPNDWAIWVQHGHAQKELGNLVGAERSYRAAVEQAPREPDPLLHLGNLLSYLGRRPEAVEFLERCVSLGSDVAARDLAAIRLIDEEAARAARRMLFRDYYVELLAAFPRQIWIGGNTIDGVQTLDLVSQPNFRADGKKHNQFDVVWLFEGLLSDLRDSQWPLLVDEAIRLLDRDGRLVVRHEQNDNISLISLRSFLARRPGITVEMEPHRVEDGGIVNALFHIRRDNLQAYRDKSWTFIILAQGNRTPAVLAFLDRLKQIGDDNPHEVIIVGPRLDAYAPYDLFVFNKEYRADYPQISVKKNEAAQFATHANLCILHDRFVLDENFFTGFDEFGYDFDIVAVRQQYHTGEPYPFYGELDKKPLIWSVPIHTKTYQNFRPTHFVNGGFAVFKRVMFEKIGYNALLAWNEGEDVEISYAFAARNIPPRVNLTSSATTNIAVSHTAMFLPDRYEDTSPKR